MLFNSLEYLVFLPISWIAFWSAPSHWRVHVLLVASYVFYASWSVPYAAMIFGLVVVNYLFGLALGRAARWRRWLLTAFVSFDLAVLGLFKYLDFGLSSLSSGTNRPEGSKRQPSSGLLCRNSWTMCVRVGSIARLAANAWKRPLKLTPVPRGSLRRRWRGR